MKDCMPLMYPHAWRILPHTWKRVRSDKQHSMKEGTYKAFIHSFILWRLIPPPGQVRVCSRTTKK